MKYIIILLSIFFFLSTTIGQNITLDQLIALSKKKLPLAEEFLSNKNWKLVKAVNSENGYQGELSFAYKKEKYNDKANSFISLQYINYVNSITTAYIQILSTDIYNAYLARLKNLGFKLSYSYVQNDEIVKIYTSKSIIIEVKTITKNEDNSTNTIYLFSVTPSLNNNNKQSDYKSLQGIQEASAENINTYSPPQENIKQEADNAYDAGEYEKASKFYLQLFKTDIIETDDLLKLGYSYYMIKNYKNALVYLKKYEYIIKDDPYVKDLIAYCYYQLDDINLAIQYSKNAIELEKSNASYYNSLGWYYILNKNFKKALEIFQKLNLMEISQEDELYYYIQSNLAHSYLFSGNYKEAMLIYNKFRGIYIDEKKDWKSIIMESFRILKNKNIYSNKIPEIVNLLE